MNLEEYFKPFREETIGCYQKLKTPFGIKPLVYADWTASGRLYRPIEALISDTIGPYIGNTHTETTSTGSAMTHAYNAAKKIIKEHVGAWESDILISSNSGMTGVINKFQRILGLKIHERFRQKISLQEEERPVVFISHMEHHSNQTSWLETIADVEIIKPDETGLMDLSYLNVLLSKYKNRKLKIAAVTSCSNVTGIFTPYHEVASLMHENDGFCFVDFACSAPYMQITMRPEYRSKHLDAIYFSPHKFLGGPGSTGILIFDPALYSNRIPDNPGGGTVDWTNPWGQHKYLDGIEAREDGGTPAFLQTMKVAMCMKLKEEMGVENILKREKEILNMIWPVLDGIPNLYVLAGRHRERLGVISFFINDLHYNLAVKLLNDRFGIQVRGGCSCAGTYGHYLLNVDWERSHLISTSISSGDLSAKPGWIRISIHPIMSDDEVKYILDGVRQLSEHFRDWGKEYHYYPMTNEFRHQLEQIPLEAELIKDWFDLNKRSYAESIPG